jgi:hypothetical protein
VRSAPELRLARAASALPALAFSTALALTLYRHVRAPLFLDFREAFYYPARALLAGINPYDPHSYLGAYPVQSPFPYPPLTLVLALPFGALSYPAAEHAYLAFALATIPLLAALALTLGRVRPTRDRVLVLAAAILLSRPGHMAVVQGQMTLPAAAAAYVALRFARLRPWCGAAGLVVALMKPTIGVPLAVLMAVRGEYRAVVRGLALAAVLSLVPTAMLIACAGGVAAFAHSLVEGGSAWSANPDNDPLTSIYRIDLVALIARVVGHAPGPVTTAALGASVLAVAAAGVWRLRRTGHARGVESTSLVCLATVSCVYHQTYDALLLTQTLVALIAARGSLALTLRPAVRRTLVALLLVPAVNYGATQAVVDAFGIAGPGWVALASLNGVAITLVLLGHLQLAASARAGAPSGAVL